MLNNVDISYYVIAFIIISVHSFLNFKLCDILSDGTRFHRASIFIVCIVNGLISPIFLSSVHSSTATPYFACVGLLIFELFLLFKGRVTGIFGVGIGSLLHLFVIRSILIPSVSIAYKISMHDINYSAEYVSYINLGSFAIQIIALLLFILLIPMSTVKKIMESKSFYRGLLSLTLLLVLYIIFNSYIFRVDYYSLILSVQEIVIVAFMLLFFYIMLLMLIAVFNLGLYREKTKVLEDKIDKDRVLTSAVFNLALIIIEVNCTKDILTRLLIGSTERPTEHLPTFSEFLETQSKEYTHPDDIKNIKTLSSQSLIDNFEKGINESVIEYRSKSIKASASQTGVTTVADEYLWYRMQINTHREEDTNDIISVCTIDEIDIEKKESLRLKQVAETDPLTGAFNKGTFASKVDDYISKGNGGALYMFDLDNFKGINDNMGHSAGDDVLCEVYAKVLTIFRSDDIVGRVGGDEFVVFLTNAMSEASIAKMAMRICDEINKVYHAENGVDIEISSSIGISVSPKDGKDFETLFNAADLAMYHSKSIGKNTYTVYGSSLSAGFKPQEKEDYMRLRDKENNK